MRLLFCNKKGALRHLCVVHQGKRERVERGGIIRVERECVCVNGVLAGEARFETVVSASQ